MKETLPVKVEMGESLMYSWLCHVKGCQIVQTNWKASAAWDKRNGAELQKIYLAVKDKFSQSLQCDLFKGRTLDQFVKQAEIDVLGISMLGVQAKLYAVDIAFHEGGLLYGENAKDTAAKVVMKYIRTAMCLYRYFDGTPAEIFFASPKIQRSTMQILEPFIAQIQDFFQAYNLPYTAALAANDSFDKAILSPVLSTSKQVADTSELFMRSYQLCQMFKR